MAGVAGAQGPRVNAQLPFHAPVVDGHGKLLAWSGAEGNKGYDKVLRLGWEFLEKQSRAGPKSYLVNSVFDPETLKGVYWQHNPAMVYASFVDSLVAWYAYSGDEAAAPVVREMLEYQLAHGTTPDGWEWPGVPFATGCGNEAEYGGCFSGVPREFRGGIETDKVSELGTGYALFYKLTGDKRFLHAAVRCADALARHVREGDDEHTPWPFRLDAKTGVTIAGMEYGGNVTAAARLFDVLIPLVPENEARYRRARAMAWEWVKRYPLDPRSKAWDKWSCYFEDVGQGVDNVNQLTPMSVAQYILLREDPEEAASNWISRTGHLIDWVRQKFGRGPYLGAWGIDEQGTPDGRGCCSRAGLSSHTSRWAAVNALYFEKTGDAQAREDAFRSLNYATYFMDGEGRTSCCGLGFRNPYWYSDGYSDYLRHFQWAMGAMPELAPKGEEHILRSTSVVRHVKYEARDIRYTTFDAGSTEVLRMSYSPTQVTEGGAPVRSGVSVRRMADGDYAVRIRHERSGEIHISGTAVAERR